MKYFNSFFAGIIFTLAPIFSVFVGLKNNYFDYYGIDEYFNSLFVRARFMARAGVFARRILYVLRAFS